MSEEQKDYKMLIVYNGGVIYRSPVITSKELKQFKKKMEEDIKELYNGNSVLIYTDDEEDDVYIQKNIAINSIFIITPNWRTLLENDIVDAPEEIDEDKTSQIEGE